MEVSLFLSNFDATRFVDTDERFSVYERPYNRDLVKDICGSVNSISSTMGE